MVTRLYSHPIYPRAPDAAGPSGAARPLARHRARARRRRNSPTLDRVEAPEGDEATILSPTPKLSCRKVRAAIPEEGHRQHRRRHHGQPEELAGGAHAPSAPPTPRSTMSSPARPTMSSSPRARPATMPKRPRRWVSACSTLRRSPRATRRRSTAPSASPSSTGTCITATARRTSSGTIRRCSTARRTRCRSIPAPARTDETGAGNIVNAPLAPRTGSDIFREAFTSRVLPAIDDFSPDLIIISAGFDAHHRDPLAEINLDEDDFDWATGQLMESAGAPRRQPARQPAGGRLRSAGTGVFGRRACRPPDERMNDGR